jgi:hypothetical protein
MCLSSGLRAPDHIESYWSWVDGLTYKKEVETAGTKLITQKAFMGTGDVSECEVSPDSSVFVREPIGELAGLSCALKH